jgi:phage antirepressor YoqD-like protein
MSNIAQLTDYQNNEVVIGDITIGQDEEGRYCLNDVHKAAGGAERHKPVHWTNNDSTQSLVYDLKVENPTFEPITAKRGSMGGTYAVKELVYAYAMWISANYHLKVIRAYDRMVTDGVAVHEAAAQDLLTNPLKYIQAIIGQAQALVEVNARLEQKVKGDVPKVEFHDAVKVALNCQTIEQVAKKYGIGRNKLFRFLRESKILRRAEGNPPYQQYLDSGDFEVEGKVRKTDDKSYLYSQTMVTGKGEIYIGELLRKAGLLPEKEAA